MSSYEELEKEFQQKFEELSDWIPEYWAPGHRTGFEIKTCKRCKIVINRRTRCWHCGSWVEERKWIEGDGKEVAIGVYFCSQECLEKYKAALKKLF
jgi:hypothetical protein